MKAGCQTSRPDDWLAAYCCGTQEVGAGLKRLLSAGRPVKWHSLSSSVALNTTLAKKTEALYPLSSLSLEERHIFNFPFYQGLAGTKRWPWTVLLRPAHHNQHADTPPPPWRAYMCPIEAPLKLFSEQVKGLLSAGHRSEDTIIDSGSQCLMMNVYI